MIMAPGLMRVTLHPDHWEALLKEGVGPRRYRLNDEMRYAIDRIEKDLEFHERIHTPGAFEEWYQKLTGKIYMDSKERLKGE